MQASDKLRLWRQIQNKSQQEVAEALGVARSYIGRLESGSARTPSLRIMWAVARLTGGEVPIESWPDPDRFTKESERL